MASKTRKVVDDLQEEGVISENYWSPSIAQGIEVAYDLLMGRPIGWEWWSSPPLKRDETTDDIEAVILALADAIRVAPRRIAEPEWAGHVYVVAVSNGSACLWKFLPDEGEGGVYCRMDDPSITVPRNLAWSSWGPSGSGLTKAFGINDLSVIALLNNVTLV